jgi:hypothetical protein
MAIDWFDQSHIHRLDFEQVSPTSLEVIGPLTDVVLESSSITAAYYTDTRTSAQLEVRNSNWVRGAFIRITHWLEGEDYRHTLGTYVVVSDDATRKNGEWVTTLMCQSVLYTLSTDIQPKVLTIKKNGSTRKAIKSILSTSGRKYRFTDSDDYKYSEAKVYEVGKSQLTRLFDICNTSKRRVEVDPDGYVRIEKAVSHMSKTPKHTLDISDRHGIMHDDLKRSSNLLEMPDRAVVAYSPGPDENDIIGYATTKIQMDVGARGFSVTEFHSVTDPPSKTQKGIDSLAKSYIKNNVELVDWDVTIQYLPIWEGDALTLVTDDVEERYAGGVKVFVKSMDIDLATMQIGLTLKLAASGDSNE